MIQSKQPVDLVTGIHLNWQQALETFDQLIRAGQSQQVIAMLSTVKLKEIPRPFLQPFAHTFYRVGLFTQGLRVLSPLVQAQENRLILPTEKELATYAILLVKIGSVFEAKKLLNDLSSQLPEVDLYRAFAEQAEWDYEKAIPHLRKYLSRSTLSDYERAVAEVNLSASLIATGETVESRKLLSHLFEKARLQQWTLIFKNAQELWGQLAVALGDFNEAQKLLTEASSKERYRENGLYDFFIDKWRAIVGLKQNPKSTEAQAQLQLIRKTAINFRHWESARECDKVLALALQDFDLLNQIYYGTLFPAYRNRLIQEAAPWAPSANFVWGSSDGVVLNLATAEANRPGITLKPGQAMHRALAALASERYRPLFVGQLFCRIFPDECFISEFSEGRVAAVISRLRKWFAQNHLPLAIEVKDQFYRLELQSTEAGFGFQFQSLISELPTDNTMASQFRRLQTKIEIDFFSSAEVASRLQISKSSAVRLLGWGVKEGKLKVSGNSKTRKYGFAA